MSTRDKCAKCVKSVKDGVQCCQCENVYHPKCVCLTDELFDLLRSNVNCRWFCEACLKLLPSIKTLTKSFDAFQKDLSGGIEQLKSSMQIELKTLKATIDANKMSDVMGDKLNNELRSTWAEVVGREVKKSVEIVNERVDAVQKILIENAHIKNKEKNIVIFRLNEDVNDKENVMKIVKHLSVDRIKDNNVVKIIRLGKRKEDIIRPVLIEFDDIESKKLIMRNVAKYEINR